ncbi:PIF1-like helicase [Medicago truncatula]|uniref:ATP-dependent DNA helicase n=1 Tax=Medicago truncatula TaxID=3880 RepID=G7L954_MEDTR|nr:PIF1-like helicase [Medicago truncatula]
MILPVVLKGTRPDVVNASINSSNLWRYCEVLTLTTNMRLLHGCSPDEVQERTEFAKWVLGIGDGCIGNVSDDSIQVEIPDDLLINSADNAILTLKNTIVDEVNNYVLSLISGEERTYLSCDSLIADTASVNRPNDIHTPEFLNTINSSGLPNHKITLKVGVPIMLLRNLDITSWLCNGTRLIVIKMGRYVIEGRVISGRNVGEKVYIPRLSLSPSDTKFLSNFNAYNVAISRVTSRDGLKILLTDDNGDYISTTSNVVYKEIFENV